MMLSFSSLALAQNTPPADTTNVPVRIDPGYGESRSLSTFVKAYYIVHSNSVVVECFLSFDAEISLLDSDDHVVERVYTAAGVSQIFEFSALNSFMSYKVQIVEVDYLGLYAKSEELVGSNYLGIIY